MKKIFLTAAMLLVLGMSYAQDTGDRNVVITGENIVLDYELPSQSRNDVIASNEIRLKPGFSANHRTIEPMENTRLFQTSLKIEDFVVYPPEAGLTGGPNSGDDGVVGAIGGTVDVSAFGGATYTIPIEVPAGINGMQPSLAISYNSQGGNGLLGYGWDLAGISSITRTGSTLFHDGKMTAANFSDDDRFLLDGQRLIKVGEGNGFFEYKTEQDEFSKIIFYKNGKEFSRCVVWQADGNIIYYGLDDPDDNSRLMTDKGQVIKWMVSRVEDRNGNAMKYHYINNQQTGEIYIDKIDYTVNEKAKVEAEFSVIFYYCKDERFDRSFYYVYGNKIQENRLLEKIIVKRKSKNTQLLEYHLTYSETGSSLYENQKMFSRLMEIGLTKDGVSLNPTRINWSGNDIMHSESDLASNLIGSKYDNFIFVGDFNGDGFSDIATVPFKDGNAFNDTLYPKGVYLNVYLNTKNGNFSNDTMASLFLSRDLDWVYVADMNDDGYDDLLVLLDIGEDPDTGGVVSKIVLYENKSGNEFEEALQIDFDKPVTNVVVGDFIGNNSISALISTSNSMSYRFIYYKNGNYYVRGVRLPSMVNPDYCYGGDFNGDGITEVLLVYPEKSMIYGIEGDNNTSSLTFKKTMNDCDEIKSGNYVFPGDINGDGKTDLFYNDYHRYMYIFLSDGECLRKTDSIWTLYWLPGGNIYNHSLSKIEKNPTYSIAVADMDGNGQVDVVEFDASPLTDIVHLRVNYNYNEISGMSSWYWIPGNSNTIGVVDCHTQYFNFGYFYGTDNISFLGLRRKYYYGGNSSTNTQRPVLFNITSAASLYCVNSIKDGLGNVAEFKYKCVVPNYSTYEYTRKFGVRPAPAPLKVLKSVTTKNSGGGYDVTSYGFSNLMYHRGGRGYLGFEKVTKTDVVHDKCVGAKSSYLSLETMDMNGGLLPSVDSTFVCINDKKILSEVNVYKFDKVTCNREEYGGVNHIIRPAMIRKKTYEYDIDNPGKVLSQSVTSFEYSYSGGKYGDTYNCKKESCGVDGNQETVDAYKHYATTEKEYFDNDIQNWVVNRIKTEKNKIGMRGKKDIYSITRYEYNSSNPFLIKNVKNIPSLDDNDPLSTSVSFEYDDVGNVFLQNVTAPNAKKGEKPGKVRFIYHDNKRLIKEMTTDPDDLAYKESYEYDDYDRVISQTGSDGLVTAYSYDNAFGSTVTVTKPDGTKTVEAVRWSNGNELKPNNSVFYKWSKTTGGATVLSFQNMKGDVLRGVTYDNKLNAVMSDVEYDNMGRVSRQSQPYKDDEEIEWSTFIYDDIGRLLVAETADNVKVTKDYNGYEVTTTTEADGIKHIESQKVNSLGWLESSTDANDAKVTYDYYADGNIAKATTSGGKVKLEVEYDNAGNKIMLKDPDYGMTKYSYDAYGRLLEQVSPKKMITSYDYDILGRVLGKIDQSEGTKTIYKYNEKEHKGTLEKITHGEQTVRYNYDEYQRPVLVTETVGGRKYTSELTYDEASRVSGVKYPSGYSVKYDYYSNGQKHTITDADGNLLWRTDDVNSMGQLLKVTTGNGVITENSYYNKTHYLRESVTSKNIQKFVYSYDKFGNLAARKDNINNVEETFTYDSINRLTGVTLNAGASVRPIHSAMRYEKYGRMNMKQMDGKTVFDEAEFQSDKPHAISSATVDMSLLDVSQRIKYTSFDKVSSLSQKNGMLSYTYGYDEQRLTMKETVDGVTRTKKYVGNCEFITENGKERILTYLTGPYGVFAVVEKSDGEENLHYIYKDHLGSWTTITDSDGKVEQRQSFDAWGNRRNATTWLGAATDEPMFDRGYTGHEHLYAFGLINMNGRMYDPLTSSFLSPDNYVQDPTSQQGFNRYAYCLYNPLKYVDPSGYLCGNPPPHEFEIMRYLMCMNSDNAQTLNELGIERIDVAHVSGSSDYTVRWVEGNNEYSMDYSGYIDSGYQCDGVYYPYSDGALPTPPAPMFYNCSYQGNYGIPVNGGNGGSACGLVSSNSNGFRMLALNISLNFGESIFYDAADRRWLGKNGKYYNTNFNGNQFTGGKLKFAKKTANWFKRCNLAFTIANGIDIYFQHENGKIDDYDFWSEEVSNGLSAIGPWGMAWNIGWELGRLITQTQGYQDFKYNLLYNMEVGRIGEPNEYNEHLWKEWYDYYEKHR